MTFAPGVSAAFFLCFLAARVRCLQPRAKERGRIFSVYVGDALPRECVCMFWKRKKCGDPALSRRAEAFERVYQVNNEDMFALRRVLLRGVALACSSLSKWKTPVRSFCRVAVPKRWNFESFSAAAKTNSHARSSVNFAGKCYETCEFQILRNINFYLIMTHFNHYKWEFSVFWKSSTFKIDGFVNFGK